MSVFTSENIKIPPHKMESYLKFTKIIQWGRKNPVHFVSRFFGIDLLDYQKYVFMSSWYTPFCLWCQSRSGGKSTLGAPFIMAKSLLVPNFQTYILAGVGSQSKEMFMKIEKIAKKEIASFTGITDVFLNEIVSSTAGRDGFTHDPASFSFRLFHGSAVNSLNSSPDALRSKRSNLVFYDESGFTPDEIFTNSKPFIAQNADFKLGGGVDSSLFPKSFPNQIIMASSASAEDTYFWERYREYGKRMIAGDKNFFTADIDCDVILKATFNGKIHNPPLLTQEVIDEELHRNPQKAMREYYNIFDADGGDAQVFKRAAIIRNSVLRPPVLYNKASEKFIFIYDPARSCDNSILLIAKLLSDEKIGYKCEICNVVSFADILQKKKTPMRYPEQQKFIREYLLNYNGELAADYENIEKFIVDGGAGGAGVPFADGMMEDWTDEKGNKHIGMIDMSNSQTSVHKCKFPNSADKMKIVQFRGLKVEMYEALKYALDHDLISFTENYDGKSSLIFGNLEENGKKDKDGNPEYDVNEKIYKLSNDEKQALVQIDLLKEEIVHTYRYENNRTKSVSYGLSPEKAGVMHDDRVSCAAMLAWYLQQIRHKSRTAKPKQKVDAKEMFAICRKVNPYGRRW